MGSSHEPPGQGHRTQTRKDFSTRLLPGRAELTSTLPTLPLWNGPKRSALELPGRRESILDAISATTSTLKRRLSKFDRQRIDQYFTSIRELEKRLESSGQWATTAKPKIDVPPPTDITDRSRFIEKLDLMLTMARLALQTDSTRIVTLMLDAFETGVFHYEQDNKTLTGYHNLSHHGQRAEHLEQLRITDIRQMELLGQQDLL